MLRHVRIDRTQRIVQQRYTPLANDGHIARRQLCQIRLKGAHLQHLPVPVLIERLAEKDVLPEASGEQPRFLTSHLQDGSLPRAHRAHDSDKAAPFELDAQVRKCAGRWLLLLLLLVERLTGNSPPGRQMLHRYGHVFPNQPFVGFVEQPASFGGIAILHQFRVLVAPCAVRHRWYPRVHLNLVVLEEFLQPARRNQTLPELGNPAPEQPGHGVGHVGEVARGHEHLRGRYVLVERDESEHHAQHGGPRREELERHVDGAHVTALQHLLQFLAACVRDELRERSLPGVHLDHPDAGNDFIHQPYSFVRFECRPEAKPGGQFSGVCCCCGVMMTIATIPITPDQPTSYQSSTAASTITTGDVHMKHTRYEAMSNRFTSFDIRLTTLPGEVSPSAFRDRRRAFR
uniref:Uncharacterized protein n=1 Tax=Anopheles atroparvus TaxID=41427 RepID=A0A182J474_ANOAO